MPLRCAFQEQKRGITMKASAISLLYNARGKGGGGKGGKGGKGGGKGGKGGKGAAGAAAAAGTATAAGAATAAGVATVTTITGPLSVPYLVNLIDSPGHIDFCRCLCLRLAPWHHNSPRYALRLPSNSWSHPPLHAVLGLSATCPLQRGSATAPW